MRRKHLLFFGGCLFFGSIWVMLNQLDSPQERKPERDENHLMEDALVKQKLKLMEEDLKTNKNMLKQIQSEVSEFLKNGNVHNREHRLRLEQLVNVAAKLPANGPKLQAIINATTSRDTCLNLPYIISKLDVNMLDVYEQLTFDDPDGGVWKQGYPISTSDEEWKGRTLKVFIVPHSHNDPGWIKTLDKYFSDQTQHILNTVVDSLMENRNRRFIWAEMSYLSMWWDIATQARKENMKQLIANGQLEIVTGGWVMNDEANTHYFNMIDQMIEGSDWLYRTLGVIPKSGWAIDPFGHTPTMAYILKRMQFDNMLIQRVHYAVKKHLSLQKSLEFRWRQDWDTESSTDILCHMMPFYSYDVPHTCGPDPKICCQFDFARLPGFKYSCPWRVPPRQITPDNIQERATTLLDQYRKKSKLYKSDTLLVILGDDFRYTEKREADAQYQNYEKIIEYVNSHTEFNARLQFATLTEYFDALKTELGGDKALPALTGDFFTYADREDHYWSGYYTSRPFHKMQDRVLASHLRAAEILFALALPVAKSKGIDAKFSETIYPLLVQARRNLGLFQHHDGITGTAKDHVVIDYGTRLVRSVTDCKKVMSQSAEVVLSSQTKSYDPASVLLDFDEVHSHQNSPPQPKVIELPDSGEAKRVVLYNSLSQARSGVVRLIVSLHNVEVTASSGDIIVSQTNLVWTEGVHFSQDRFELVFLAKVPPLGLVTYTLRSKTDPAHNTPAVTTIFNQPSFASEPSGPFLLVPGTDSHISLDNDLIVATVSSQNGNLQKITNLHDNSATKISLEFVAYASRMSKDKSGAYLFLPAGVAKPHVAADHRPLIRHVAGPVLSEVQVVLPNVVHRLTVYSGDGSGVQNLGVHVTNLVDVRSGYDNKELAMRLSSDVQSDSKFFTDLNGFQMQSRTTYQKLPTQANFYPMPAMAYVQDKTKRVTLLTKQPLGVASLASGQLEVIMDRRLMQDDNRGVGQGVKDNVPTPEDFVILVEQWERSDVKKTEAKLSYPSLVAHTMSWQLLHPLRSMPVSSFGEGAALETAFSPSLKLPCDVFLLNLRVMHDLTRPLPSQDTALLLHRVGYECDLASWKLHRTSCAKSGDVIPTSLFRFDSVCETSLSLVHKCESIPAGQGLNLKPMEIKALKLQLTT